MDPGIPVPPKLYGGIERIVYQLAEEYIKLGNEVILLAGPDSYCSGKVVTYGKNNLEKSKLENIKEILFVWTYLIKNKNKIDVVHSFGRLVYLLPILNSKIKKIMSYQREVTVKNIQVITKMSNRELIFSGCSDYITQKSGLTGYWKTVYNFVEFSAYNLIEAVSDDAPLIFLGRIDRIKGCHHAIKLAKITGRSLVIAGNISHLEEEKTYYEKEIKPHIDNIQIQYIGAVDDTQKNKLFSNAFALLMLIDWDEPFGIVMVEAMACGVPVIGFKRGAIPEVVEEGITGFVIEDFEEAILALDKIKNINRVLCRERAKQKFSLDVVARNYFDLFKSKSYL